MKQNRKEIVSSKKLYISVIVPVNNEEKLLKKFLDELIIKLSNITTKYEIIVIDDGSTDKTSAILKKKLKTTNTIKLITFSRNFGKEAAISAGLEMVSGRVTIIMDADFQHPFSLIDVFIENWIAGYYMVYGIKDSRKTEGLFKNLFARLFYFLININSEVKVPINAGDFRLMDMKVVKAIKLLPEKNRFMKGLYAWVGFKNLGIKYSVGKSRRKSKWGMIKLLQLAITGFTSFSLIPLKIWSVVGFIISAVAFVYGIIIITKSLFFGIRTPGFPTLATIILFLGGIQLLSVGIMGEYIGNIFTESKNRPLFIVKEKIGFNKSKKSPQE